MNGDDGRWRQTLRSRHLRVERLLAYVRGELTQTAAREVRQHAVECADCGDQLAALILLQEEAQSDGPRVTLADVRTFPVPAASGRVARLWRHPRLGVGAVAAAVVVLIVFAGWYAGSYSVPGAGLAAESPPHRTAVVPGEPGAVAEVRAEDLEATLETVAFIADIVPAQASGQVAADDARLPNDLGLALRDIQTGAFAQAQARLAPFATNWDLFGTAVLGCLLFVERDPQAGKVLEAYAAGHPTQSWASNATTPEDLAFYFLARVRHARGDDAGARQVIGWIDRTGEVGVTAGQWATDALGVEHAKSVGSPRVP